MQKGKQKVAICKPYCRKYKKELNRKRSESSILQPISRLCFMDKLRQLNRKGLRAGHKELEEIMFKIIIYNLRRQYEFYATAPPDQSKGGTALAIRKEIIHRRMNIRSILQVVTLLTYLIGKGK